MALQCARLVPFLMQHRCQNQNKVELHFPESALAQLGQEQQASLTVGSKSTQSDPGKVLQVDQSSLEPFQVLTKRSTALHNLGILLKERSAAFPNTISSEREPRE